MKIAYLLLAHKNPHLIKRLIEFLGSEDCGFFLHIDQKSPLEDFSSLRGQNIFFCDRRIPVYWAEYSMVEAILMLIRQALAAPHPYDYFILLSGSDYPLQNNRYIHNFFEKNQGTEYISIKKIPDRQAGLPREKIDTVRISSDKPAYRFLMRGLAKLGLANRDHKKYLGALEPYGGSTWWGLTRQACLYILEFAAKNQGFCDYFRKTFSSDEMFFHTILGNSAYKDRITRTFMYDDWSSGGGHPAEIGEKQLKFFARGNPIIFSDSFGPGEMLFARKVSDSDFAIVEKIEGLIQCRDSAGSCS